MSKPFRPYIVLVLAAAYCLLVLFHTPELPRKEVFSPLAYLALVLSALWWGRRGGLLAGLFAVAEIASNLWNAEISNYWGDTARMISFFVVVVGLGAVKEHAIAAFRARREFERKYHDIVEKSLAGILVYRDERLLYANPRFRKLLKYEDSDLVGTPFWAFIHEEEKPKIYSLLQKRIAGSVTDLHYECRLLAQDGEVMWADIVSSPVEYEGKPAVLVSVYDITRRKEIEERDKELIRLARRQEEQLTHSTRLAEMGEMAAGIAHELNQPLTGIKNYAKNALYMIEQGLDEGVEVKGNLQLISTQVDRASRIIGQMRELARRTEFQFAAVDVNQELREAIEFVVPQMRLGGVEVTVDLARDLPEVTGDGLRLEQVFLNLLVNARQAMEESHQRHLAICTRHEPESKYPVIIEISDTGKGFPDDLAPRLFAPFFTTKEAGQGTGLGLSISLSIIEYHKGTIEAKGEVGKGATFTVRLPKRVPEPPPPQNASSTRAGEVSAWI